MNPEYRIETAKVEHFYQMKARDYDAKVLFGSYASPDKFLKQYTDNYAFTGFYGDDIITIAGLFPLGPGKAEAWMFTGDILPKHSKFIIRQLRRHLRTAEICFGLKRIQSLVVDHFEPAHRFIQRFGFECETPNGMKNHGPNNENYYLYARTC